MKMCHLLILILCWICDIDIKTQHVFSDHRSGGGRVHDQRQCDLLSYMNRWYWYIDNLIYIYMVAPVLLWKKKKSKNKTLQNDVAGVVEAECSCKVAGGGRVQLQSCWSGGGRVQLQSCWSGGGRVQLQSCCLAGVWRRWNVKEKTERKKKKPTKRVSPHDPRVNPTQTIFKWVGFGLTCFLTGSKISYPYPYFTPGSDGLMGPDPILPGIITWL